MTTTSPAPVTAESLVARLFQVIDSRSWDRLGEVFAPDAVYERPGYPALEGLDRIRRFYEHERIITSGAHEVSQVTGGLAAAACWGRFQGADKDGKTLDEAFADTYLVRDGRIERRKTFFYRPAI
ncbi:MULTISPECIES: nuclear transport factor 2 family protein [unclassified Streptomyces]|uniref:nuclear transport factor 2 family protein n=1 Tax=unclassified Streptomyces TaxID=2593676 RepID=UPI00225145D5|nr:MULTISPECIES: nuclear transport factor 2 family protein [unclassified Streptomyces]MCX5407105.1 nuclear transport factor 2 family protein [Streptomyces sp. NBC_00086]WSP38600.1 nuclear transport factor 2 family protein [Streptomyces sp. NBC_01244]